MYFRSKPRWMSSPRPRATSSGFGKRSLPLTRTAISHAAMKATMTETGRMSAFQRASAFGPATGIGCGLVERRTGRACGFQDCRRLAHFRSSHWYGWSFSAASAKLGSM